MELAPASNKKRPLRRISRPPRIYSLNHDVLTSIFSLLEDCFDLINCSLVCKTWRAVITKSKLVESLYYKQRQMGIVKGLCFEEMAAEAHRFALNQSRQIVVDQWKTHAIDIKQCRKKKSLLLTGGGDRVLRLWSVKSHDSVYKFEGEYKVPMEYGPLVDFDFDESKIVGLVGSKMSRICLWRPNGMARVLSPLKDECTLFPKGTCMRYFDPKAVIGCADGTARVFDIYSGQCSQILGMHRYPEAPVTCLVLSEENDSRLLLLAAGGGSIAMSSGLTKHSIAQFRLSHYGEGDIIKTLCYNSCGDDNRTVFAGSSGGYVYAWDLRMRRKLWTTQMSRGAVCSVQQLRNGVSTTLVVGGDDGVLRIVDENIGEVTSRIVLDTRYCSLPTSSSNSSTTSAPVQRLRGRRVPEDTVVDGIPTPPVTCVAVGMKEVITTHNRDYIRTWKFN